MYDTNSVRDAIASLLKLSPGSVARKFDFDPFAFSIDFGGLGFQGVSTQQFVIPADYGFAICAQSAIEVPTPGPETPFGSGIDAVNVPIIITLSDSDSGVGISNTPIPLDAWFGTAIRPFILPIPKILSPHAQMTCIAQSVEGDPLTQLGFDQLRLTFHGLKVTGEWKRLKDRVALVTQ